MRTQMRRHSSTSSSPPKLSSLSGPSLPVPPVQTQGNSEHYSMMTTSSIAADTKVMRHFSADSSFRLHGEDKVQQLKNCVCTNIWLILLLILSCLYLLCCPYSCPFLQMVVFLVHPADRGLHVFFFCLLAALLFYDLFSGTCVICVFAGSYSQTRRTYKPNPSSHQSVPSDTDSTGQLFVRCWLDSQSLIKDYNSGANTNWNFQFVTCQVSFGTKTSYFLQVFYFLYGNLEV